MPRQRPALSIGVIVTLALGVAALTTACAIVRAALWREPPFPAAARLGILFFERHPAHEPPRRERWSFARSEQLRASQHSFDAIATFSLASLTLSGAGDRDAEIVYGERVSADYLAMLGAVPASGRLFVEADDDPARPSPIAVVSERLWQRRFGSDTFTADRTIRLNGVPLSVVGVLPADFRGLSGRADLWIPRTVSPQIAYADYLTTNQNFIPVVGRLRPGIEWPEAQAELAGLAATINRALPSDPQDPNERVSATAVPVNDARGDPAARRSLPVLLAAVALLHLLACANVANLLLGHAAERRPEYAVRLALGSGSGRLFRHVFAEGATLALAGGVLGVIAAWGATGVAALPRNSWSTAFGIVAPFDTPAFSGVDAACGLALALATAIVVAVVPAMTARRVDVAAGVRSSTRTSSGRAMSLRRPTLRAVLVTVEAAVAAILVVGAGLLWDSFQHMQRANVGVDADRVLTFWIIPSEARVPTPAAPAFVGRVIDAIARVPGVEGVTVDGGAPLSGSASSTLFIAGQPPPDPGQAPPVLRHYVAPGHFRTLGIPVVQGRAFTAADSADAPRVAIISETAARRFWPKGDALGQRVWFGGGSTFDSPDRSARIVGIVGDVAYDPFDRRANFASFYTPYTQFTYPSRAVFVRTIQDDPMAVLADVRRAVASVDPELALQDPQALAGQLRASWARQRLDTTLFSGFGLSALGLAASGVFAVLAYSVSTRRREFGIRIALGARTGRIVWLVIGEGMVFPVAGLLAGLAASLALTPLLRSSLYETSPLEPRVFLVVAAVLTGAALVASLVPAWRATKANPVESLRAE
jgi:putative ABC transport system permease protein